MYANFSRGLSDLVVLSEIVDARLLAGNTSDARLFIETRLLCFMTRPGHNAETLSVLFAVKLLFVVLEKKLVLCNFVFDLG